MAHPDHDRVIGRLVGARLRGPAGRRPGSASAAEVHPDAETWAAYVDGGLLPDEVSRLEDHLAGCVACRRLVAALAPEVSAAAVPAVRDAEATAGPATVIPFPRRQVFVWMGVAASLFAAVTLWSVSRLGSHGPALDVAMSVPPPAAAVAAPASPPESSAAGERSAGAPAARADAVAPVDQPGDRAPGSPRRRPAQAEQDKTAATTDGDTVARHRGGAAVPAAGRAEPAAAVGALAGAAAGGAARGVAKPAEGAKPVEEKRLADAAPVAAPAANPRPIQLQTNTVAAGAARAHGPLANQATNTQQNAKVAQTPAPPSPAPVVAAGPAPPPAPAPATAKPDAAKAPAQADARERSETERQGALAEVVTTTGPPPGARATRRPPARAQAAGADRPASAPKDEAATAASFALTAAPPPVFGEPGGRLQWRIVEGVRLESSSDGGVTWNRRFTAPGRLRAGTAPAIDSAWAVGEGGLVLRLSVPGGWTVVSAPVPLTLVGVSATGAQSARVTAADGRVFETADGGATWTPVRAGPE